MFVTVYYKSSEAVVAAHFLDFAGRERMQADHAGPHPEIGRDDVARLVLALGFHDHPRLVVAVLAAPIGAGQEVGAAAEKRIEDADAGLRVRVVRDFHQEPWHGEDSEVESDSDPEHNARPRIAAGRRHRAASSVSLSPGTFARP